MTHLRRRALCLALSLVVLVPSGPGQATETFLYWNAIEGSPAASLLAEAGITESAFNNWMARIATEAGLRPQQVEKALVILKNNRDHRFWKWFIDSYRLSTTPGGQAGIALREAARLLGRLALIVVVAVVFYSAGQYCGERILERMDVDGVLADREAVRAATELLERALASGRWQLKPGLTREQAVRRLVLNLKQKGCPEFASLIQTVPAQCPKTSPARAASLSDYYGKNAEKLLSERGAGDRATQDAVGLAECYRRQAGR